MHGLPPLAATRVRNNDKEYVSPHGLSEGSQIHSSHLIINESPNIQKAE